MKIASLVAEHAATGSARARFAAGVGVLFALALSPTLAMADDDDWGRRGFYLGVNGVWGNDFLEDQVEGVAESLIDVKSTGGLNARAGYRLFSWLAFEALYEWMDNFSIEDAGLLALLGVPCNGCEISTFTTHTIVGGPKFVLPTWRIQPYLTIGLGAQRRIFEEQITGLGLVDERDWAFALRPGIGADFYLTPNILLNLEVAGAIAFNDINQVGSSVNDNAYLSVGGGLQYRF